jgi:hypothetical protein
MMVVLLVAALGSETFSNTNLRLLGLKNLFYFDMMRSQTLFKLRHAVRHAMG